MPPALSIPQARGRRFPRVTPHRRGKMSKASDISLLLLDILIANADAAYSSSLIGTNLDTPRKRFEFFHNPRVGDLVMEMSTIGFRECNRTRIGYLVKITEEPYPVPDGMTEEEYRKEYEPEPIPTERVYYISLLVDGSECRWTNARFIRVVEDWRVFP